MNKIAEKWVKALRSGKYKQTRNTLTKASARGKILSHCCLGVLCELAVKEGIVPRTVRSKTKGKDVYYGKPADQSNSLLPHKVQKWAKLKTPNGLFPGGSLVHLNDADKKSFKYIAKVIEQKAEQLFE